MTVEELRTAVKTIISVPSLICGDPIDTESMALVDDLIAAARAEGESEIRAIFDMLWSRMGEWEDEWRAENPKERKLTSPDSIQLIEWKIAKAHAEGTEQERERIRSGSKYLDCSDEDVALSFWHVPASVLAPKEKP